MNKKIRYEFFDKQLLSRKLFVNNDVEKFIKQQISNGKPILFMPNYIQTIHDFVYQSAPYPTNILLVGTLLSGAKASVLLHNPPIYFDIFSSKLVIDQDIDYTPGIDFGENINIDQISDTNFLNFITKINDVCSGYSYKSKKYICKKIYNIKGARN